MILINDEFLTCLIDSEDVMNHFHVQGAVARLVSFLKYII